jgi:hypothetical protein
MFGFVAIHAFADKNPSKNKTSKSANTLEYSKWSIGITTGPLGSYRWLYDNPRYKSGESPTNLISGNNPLPFDDKQFIKYRNKYEKIRLGSLWGLNLEYKINDNFSIQCGSNIYGIGERIYTNTISEQEFKDVFGGIEDTLKNSFLVREFPLILKFNISPHVKYDLIKKSFLNYHRHLIGMMGVGLAKPVLNNSYYSQYMHFGEGNTMVNAIAGIGISQQLGKRFNLSLSTVFRYSFTPAIEYSSINEYYYTLGIEANLRYLFASRVKRNFIEGSSFDCFDPRNKPQKKLKGPRILMGVITGINISTYWGADATNEEIGQFEEISSTYGDYDSFKGHWWPRIGPHAGLHVEYNFAKNVAAIATELMYSQKGIVNKYTYSWTDDALNNEYMNTIIKARLDYFDMPVFFKIRFMPQNYFLVGGMFSLYTGDKIMTYYQHFDDNDIISGSGGTDSNYGTTDFSSYYYSNPNIFVKGLMLGYELNIDDNVDLNFRIQQTDNVSTDHYKLFNITAQVSLIYMFSKRNKELLED